MAVRIAASPGTAAPAVATSAQTLSSQAVPAAHFRTESDLRGRTGAIALNFRAAIVAGGRVVVFMSQPVVR